ncbi:MAG: bifunctional DNA-formamidopyrimidine glycosylase/DNA-(apurinic or apyrimidinic site) lyase [Patescibacteria group bacterium]
MGGNEKDLTMPELPEVETTVRELRRYLVGLKITRLWTDWPRISRHQPFTKLAKKISGHKIVAVRRRAKYIVLDLDGSLSAVIHQKISGHLLYGRWRQKGGRWLSDSSGPLGSDPKNAYLRLVLWLNNGYQLALSDLRRFGTIALDNDLDIENGKVLEDLGPEPLEISPKEFNRLFEKKKGYLKPVLMDPRFIVGIGNIYADEILWHAGLHPKSRVEKLTQKDIGAIYKFTRSVLKTAIRHGGASVDDYRHPSGKKGSFQNITRAYQRTGKPCLKKDGGTIERIVIGQRSAHFCPKHQKLRQ